MTTLVAGADAVDAGKTTFAVGFVERRGATGFKPRAGNDYWFDHDDFRGAVGASRLYGKDARRLADASPAAIEPEAINPVHRLWRPAPAGDGFLGPRNRSFVLDRVDEDYVVNGQATVPPLAREHLPLEEAIVVETVDELNAVMRDKHLSSFRDLAVRIERSTPAVVESYGDIARPIRDIDVDRVAVVEPGRVRVYDGDRYWDACAVATGRPSTGQLEERVSDVTDLIDPVGVLDLPPLPAATRSSPQRIANAYQSAYELL